MKQTPFGFLSATSLAITLLCTQAQAAPQYKFTDLGSDIRVSAINNLGQIVGGNTSNQTILLNNNNNQYATKALGNGKAIAINDLGQVVTESSLWTSINDTYYSQNIQGGILGINNNSQVLLSTNTIWQNGNTSDIWAPYENFSLPGPNNPLGDINTRTVYASAINDNGIVLGKEYIKTASASTGYLSNTSVTTVVILPDSAGKSEQVSNTIINGDPSVQGPLFYTGETLSDISNTGYYVGYDSSPYSSYRTAFLRDINGNNPDAILPKLSLLPDYLNGDWFFSAFKVNSMATAVNDSNQVVGTNMMEYNCSPFEDRCFADATLAALWENDSAIDLNDVSDSFERDFILTDALDINEEGIIIGLAENRTTGLTHSFVLTPVPEPETTWLMIFGLGLIVCLHRKKVH